jgi:outer membrane protein
MRMTLLVLAFLTILPATALAQTKIGYVDLQRAIMETDDGKQAKMQLEKMKTARQTQLDQEQVKLRDEGKSLEAQKAIMMPEKFAQKEREFAQRIQKLRMTYATLQKELQAEEAKLTRGILEQMGTILSKLGRAKGYSVILEKTESRILWAPQSLDLTNELIRKYNAGKGKKSKKSKKSKK